VVSPAKQLHELCRKEHILVDGEQETRFVEACQQQDNRGNHPENLQIPVQKGFSKGLAPFNLVSEEN
jgi:hypothetical protein